LFDSTIAPWNPARTAIALPYQELAMKYPRRLRIKGFDTISKAGQQNQLSHGRAGDNFPQGGTFEILRTQTDHKTYSK
jgi:hypothetical protein